MKSKLLNFIDNINIKEEREEFDCRNNIYSSTILFYTISISKGEVMLHLETKRVDEEEILKYAKIVYEVNEIINKINIIKRKINFKLEERHGYRYSTKFENDIKEQNKILKELYEKLYKENLYIESKSFSLNDLFEETTLKVGSMQNLSMY